MFILNRILLIYIPILINLCLITILSYYAVHLGLNLYAPLQSVSRLPVYQNAPIVNSSIFSDLSVQPILNAHLFGKVARKNPQPPIDNKLLADRNISETKLKINLQGIYHSDDVKHSFVIIDDKKFTTNMTIQAGVQLYQIQPKKIILKTNNYFESLKLRALQLSRSQVDNAKNIPQKTTETLLADYRHQLKTNPRALMQLAQIQPAYDNDKLIGYRLSASKDEALLSRFNLQVGDILTTVNNVELDSPLKGLSLMQQLSEAEQLDLTVLRNGHPYSFSFNIKN